MHTIYFFEHTHERTGRRVRTRYRLTEAEAQHRLIAPKRIDAGAMSIDAPAAATPSGHWRCGLVQREDGAMMPGPTSSSVDPATPTTPLPH